MQEHLAVLQKHRGRCTIWNLRAEGRKSAAASGCCSPRLSAVLVMVQMWKRIVVLLHCLPFPNEFLSLLQVNMHASEKSWFSGSPVGVVLKTTYCILLLCMMQSHILPHEFVYIEYEWLIRYHKLYISNCHWF